MKKELALHFLILIILFALITLLHFNISFWPFWVGGLIGTLLPDIDHVIYVYYLRPYEATSQRVINEVQHGNLLQSWDLLSSTRTERRNLILHSVIFQILFIILSFLVVTSSPSLFGKGLVIAFLLHLLVDEVVDLRLTGSLMYWFKNIPFQLDQIQLNIYLIVNFAIILIFGLLT